MRALTIVILLLALALISTSSPDLGVKSIDLTNRESIVGEFLLFLFAVMKSQGILLSPHLILRSNFRHRAFDFNPLTISSRDCPRTVDHHEHRNPRRLSLPSSNVHHPSTHKTRTPNPRSRIHLPRWTNDRQSLPLRHLPQYRWRTFPNTDLSSHQTYHHNRLKGEPDYVSCIAQCRERTLCYLWDHLVD